MTSDGNYLPDELPSKFFLFLDLEDLIASGRLHAASQRIRRSMAEAIGVLGAIWHVTQSRGLFIIARAELARLIRVRLMQMAPGVKPDEAIDAMADADLLVVDGELCRIKGNDKQLAKLADIKKARSNAGRRGGLAKKANRNKDDGLAIAKQPLAGAKQTVANRSPDPVPSKDLETTSEILRTSISEPTPLCAPAKPDALTLVAPEPPKRGRSEAQRQRSRAVRAMYCQLHVDALGHEPPGQDAKFNSQIARFSDRYGEDALTIVRQLFDSPNRKYAAERYPVWFLERDAGILLDESKHPRRAVESLAAPVRRMQDARSAATALVVEEGVEAAFNQLALQSAAPKLLGEGR